MSRRIIGITFDKGTFYYEVEEINAKGKAINKYVNDDDNVGVLRRILKNGSASKVGTKNFQTYDYGNQHPFIENWFFYPLHYCIYSRENFTPEYYQIRELLFKAWRDHNENFGVCNDSNFYSNRFNNREVLQLMYKKLCANFAKNNYNVDLGILCRQCQQELICKETNLTEDDYTILCNYIRAEEIVEHKNDLTLIMKTVYQLREILNPHTIQSLIFTTLKALSIIREDNPNYKYSTKGAIQDIIKNIAHDYTSALDDTATLKKIDKVFSHNQTLRDLHFEDDNFIVVVPTTYQELVDEGNAQRNCAAHYEFNNYLRHGYRTIVFVRRKGDIEHSYITCDMDCTTHTIRQYLSYGNSTVREENALAFKQKYQEYLKTLDLVLDSEIEKTNIDSNNIFSTPFYNLY